VDYHTLLLTNFSAFIGQQIVFVPLLLINLLSSIKTIVLIVVNTSLLTQTIRRWMKSTVMRRGIKTFRWRMKSSKISKWRNASKKVGDHCYRIMFSFGPPQLDNLALNKTKQQTENWSGPCKHCALYGCYGKQDKSMVPAISYIPAKTKPFSPNHNLTGKLCFHVRPPWYAVNTMLAKQ